MAKGSAYASVILGPAEAKPAHLIVCWNTIQPEATAASGEGDIFWETGGTWVSAKTLLAPQ